MEAVDLLADEGVDLLAAPPTGSQADVRRTEPRELSGQPPAYYPRSLQQEARPPSIATQATPARETAPDRMPAAVPEATDAELAAAASPARMTLTKAGQPVLEGGPAHMPPAQKETADWTGEGGVLPQLPAGMVAGSKLAIAGLNQAMRSQILGVISRNVQTGKDPLGYQLTEIGMMREKMALEQATQAGEEAKTWAKQVQREVELVTPKDMSTEQQAVWSLVQSAPSTLLGISVGILSRNPALAMSIAGGGGGAIQGGTTYLEAIQKGATHERALGVGALDAVLEGLGEALPLSAALKKGSPFLTRLGNTMLAETGQESATQVAQDLNAYLNWNPDITLKQAWENLKVAALAGAMGGGVYGTAGHAMEQTPRQQADAELKQVAKDIEATDVTAGNEQAAVDLLSPDRAQMRVETPPNAAAQVPEGATLGTVPPAAATPDAAAQAAPSEALPAEAVLGAQPEAAPATEAPARPRGKPAFMRVDPGRDSLTTAIGKLGGLSMDEAADITGESATARAPNSPMHFVIRRNGGLSLDGMAEALVEAGYFPNRDDLNPIRDAIADELAGRGDHYSMWASDDRASAKARIEAQNDTEREAIKFAEDAGIPELEKVSTSEDLSLHRDYVPASEAEMTGPRLALAELTQRVADIDENAPERLAIASEGMSDAEYATSLQEFINANEQDVAGRDRGVGQAVEPFALAGETEVERQARETSERAIADRSRTEADQRESRARADRERQDFGLTGSDRAADANSDQETLFDTSSITPAAQAAWPQLAGRIAELAQKITPTVTVNAVESVWHYPPFNGAVEVSGNYNARRNLIQVSLAAGENVENTFRHEAVHALKAMGLFTPQEWKALESQASKEWRSKYGIDKSYADFKLDERQLNEEAIAFAYGDYRAGTLSAQPPIQKIMRKIADFFQRLGNLLRGMGFQKVEDIFAKVEAGDVGRREPGAGPWDSPDGVKYALGPNLPNQPAPQAKQTYVASASRQLRRSLTNPPPNTWEADAGLVKRLLVTPRTIAAFDADFVPVYQTAVEQWKFRDQLIAKFERASEPYFKASAEDQAIVGKILEHDRLTGQVALAGKNMTVHFTSTEAALSKQGERVTVTDPQKTAYWSVRNMLNMALDEFTNQTLEDYGLARGLNAAAVQALSTVATTPAEAQRLQKVADILKGIEDARRTGYVPFSRYGEVGIAVRNPLTDTLVHYEMIELGMLQKRGGKQLSLIPEVNTRLTALRAKYPGMKVSEPFQVPKTGMPQQVKLEEVDALAEMAKIDNQTWDSVRSKLAEAVASQGFRAHFFRSKNTPGYNTNFERGLANYVNGISGYLARRRYSSKWVAALSPISTNKPRLRQYAQDYQKYVNSPAEEFGFLRSVNFVYYLTSVATWITNLTQIPFVSMPWTTQFANPVAVTTAYTRASAETAAMLTVKKGMQLFSAQKAPADVRAAVQAAYDQGLFIPITTYESMGIARNQGRRLRNLSKASQTAVELFGLGFTMAERQNRIATFIALYRMARDRPEVRQNFERVMAGNALGKELSSRWSPEAFAEFGIDETHFKSGKVNRPTLARNAGTVVFQFKMFMWNMLERMVTMTTLQGAEGRAAAALMLMVLGTFAGLWGLPGAENMRDLYELLMKKIKNRDVNADAEMRKIIVELTGSATLAQAVSGGATRALPEPWNIDLSKRVGMGKILPSEPGELAGVSYDLWAKRPMQAMEQFEVDNFLLGLAELMPKQAGDFMTQLAWAESGVRSKASDQPVIPPEKVTTGMRVVKGIGFTPGNVANIREGERAEQVAKNAANESRNDFYRRLAKAVAEEVRTEQSGDLLAHAAAQQREDAIWRDIDAWNKDKPDYLQVKLDRKSARSNLVKEFEGADYDKGTRKAARGEVEKLRQVYGR